MQAAVLLVVDPPMLDGKLQAHCQPKRGTLVLQVRGWGKPLKNTGGGNSSNYVKHTEPKNGRRSLNSDGQGWEQAVGPEKMKINKAHLNAHKKCIL
jgi:hypothetical protein